MSVVKRERHGKKRKRASPPAAEDGRVREKQAGKSIIGPPTEAASSVQRSASAYEEVAQRSGLDPFATVVFIFGKSENEKRIEVNLATLLRGASPGWLLAVCPEAAGEAICVPEDTPLAEKEQVAAFQILVESMVAPGKPLLEAFCGELRLLPQAYLAAHLLGLESSAVEVRSLFLRGPEAVLRSLRLKKGDGQSLLRALELGMGRCAGPARPGVTEQIEAAKQVLLLGDGADAAARLGKLLQARPLQLLHLFRAARLLHSKEARNLLRLAASRPGALKAALNAMDIAPGVADLEALRAAIHGRIDEDAGEQVLHIAAGLGRLCLVQVATAAGQAVNALSRSRGESPAMLTAAAGSAEVLRWLLRAQADLSLRCRKTGFTARDYAVRHEHAAVLRLLDDPLSRLA